MCLRFYDYYSSHWWFVLLYFKLWISYFSWRDSGRSVLEYLAVWESHGALVLPGVSPEARSLQTSFDSFENRLIFQHVLIVFFLYSRAQPSQLINCQRVLNEHWERQSMKNYLKKSKQERWYVSSTLHGKTQPNLQVNVLVKIGRNNLKKLCNCN